MRLLPCLLVTLALTACAPVGEDAGADKQAVADDLASGKADSTLDWCARWGWYNDGECDQFCLKPDPDCQSDPLGPAPVGQAARYPIVLVHGFMGGRNSPLWGFYKVDSALIADGHDVYLADLPPFDAPAGRALVLADQIDAVLAATGAAKVNIVAHSQGGLDARYLISSLGYGDRVASLTTISTPHRGSAIADLALGLLPGGLDGTMNAVLRTFGIDIHDVKVRAAMTALAEQNSAAFNAANPDDGRVFYQSWAGVSSKTGVASSVDLSPCEGKLLVHPGTMDKLGTLMPALVWRVVGHDRGDANDGVATVESAKHGLFRGCFPADHMDEVGQVQDTYDRATGFDHLRFYRNLAFDLAARGF
jgi:triacylglycerol lipase